MQRGKRYFDKRCGREVSLEETEQWLGSLADLVSCLLVQKKEPSRKDGSF